MKANELRIGNLVYWIEPKKNGVPHKVVMIHENRIHTKPISLGESIEDYSPIPLTEEWILKFGFAKIQNIYQRLNQILLEPILNGSNRSYRVKFWTTSIARAEPIYQSQLTIQYVHQLQNLYFSLTGEELTIK